jgi:hypothetical protein
LTLSQSFAHFFRHSNGSPQRAQTLGSKPFFFFAVGMAVTYSAACQLGKSTLRLHAKGEQLGKAGTILLILNKSEEGHVG